MTTAIPPLSPLPTIDREVQVLSGTAFLDSEDMAARLGLSPRTVRQMAKSGKLPAWETPAGWRFHLPTVIEQKFPKRRKYRA